MVTPRESAAGAYRTIWRWHFYAGLFVLPFILLLSVTGSIYLFKPQIDYWEERDWRGLGLQGAVSPDRQLEVALAANPGARFNQYRLPERAGDAAMIQLGLADGTLRDVFVSPQGKVLATRQSYSGISDFVARIHGSLLLGKWGDWLVELAASWTIVMVLTGLYLWWPRPFALAGTFWPRLSLRGRPLLKDLHRVVGFWIAGLLLVMLASGLPWAGAWGSAFNWVRTELGLIQGPQDWKVGAEVSHAGHDHASMLSFVNAPVTEGPVGLPLATFVAKARGEHMAFPVLIIPPHAPQRFGPNTGDDWTVKSEPQNRALGRQVTFDARTGSETGRSGFADKDVIDRIVNYGIAWHEGQLFGLANQLIGVATAIALITMSLVGVLMWLKRRPRGELGAPPPLDAGQMRWAIAVLLALCLLLPLFGASLLAMAILDRLWVAIRGAKAA